MLDYCQAQFQFSTSQVELSLALSLIITTHPPTWESRDAAWNWPYIWSVGSWWIVCLVIFGGRGSLECHCIEKTHPTRASISSIWNWLSISIVNGNQVDCLCMIWAGWNWLLLQNSLVLRLSREFDHKGKFRMSVIGLYSWGSDASFNTHVAISKHYKCWMANASFMSKMPKMPYLTHMLLDTCHT